MKKHTGRVMQASILAVLLAAIALMVPARVAAHGGEEHVVGTVASVSDTSITVRTTAGKTVEVALRADTTYSQAQKTIRKGDVRVGDRIVIHAMEMGGKLAAHTVETGTPAATARGTKSTKKR